MKPKSRIIFDTTQLVHWQGRLSGIPRVIHEMALRYSKVPGVVFATWDKYSNEYVIIDLGLSLRDRGKQIHYLKNSTSSEAALEQSQPKVSLKVEIKAKAKEAAKRAGVERYARAAWRRLNRTTEHGLPPGHQIVDFKAGDTLLVLWGEMQYDHFAQKLTDLTAQGVKLVQTIHDMIPIVVPQYNGHSTDIMVAYCKKVLPVATRLVVVSQNTKADVTSWLASNNLPVPPIGVVRLGEDFSVTKKAAPPHPELSGLKKDNFILCVGTVEARKNHTILYYAYKLAKSQGIELPTLVVVGGRGYRTENIVDIIQDDPDTRSSILLPTNVDDSALAWLYENCYFTVYPSFYEGWGIPIAESMFNKKPALVSATSSMTEIAGDLVEYFNPFSSEECLQGLVKLSNKSENTKARKKLSSYKPTTWTDTFNKLDKIVKESVE